MVITSLIFLLLSNSITLRRDKSILYSRATITILLISSFIAYDNLFFLFLNKGIGIFSGLFTTTAITFVENNFVTDMDENAENDSLINRLNNFYLNIGTYVKGSFRRKNLNTVIERMRTYLDSNN